MILDYVSSNLLNFTGNLVEENANGVGGWGGTCECPDGSRYKVGDNIDSCETLACVHGTKIDCNRHDGSWSRKKVTCNQKGRLFFKNI